MGDPEGLVLRHGVDGAGIRVAARHAAENSEKIVASLGQPGCPPHVAAGGPEDDGVPCTDRLVDEGGHGLADLEGLLSGKTEVVHDDSEGPARPWHCSGRRYLGCFGRPHLGRLRLRFRRGRHRLEVHDLLPLPVLLHHEVVLREPLDGLAVGVDDDYVEREDLDLCLELRRGGLLGPDGSAPVRQEPHEGEEANAPISRTRDGFHVVLPVLGTAGPSRRHTIPKSLREYDLV
jgi:hypothetical protein